jgi:predicted dehydrogenase
MSNYSIGIVGLGWVAGAHIETFKSVEGADVTAVCSRRAHSESDLANQYGVALKAYRDYEEMLQDETIDIVDICTPHPFHAEQAIAAAEAGKHLIIEKPIALSFEDAKSIKEAIEAAGVLACVCFEARFSQHIGLIRSFIDQKLLGELHYCEVDYYHGIGPWYGQFEWNVKKDMGGSTLLTAGCHALDSLLFFVDSDVEEVTSYSTKSTSEIFESYEYDTSSVTIIRFVNGSVGKVASVVDCLQPYYYHIHLVGSDGSLLDNKFYSHRLHGLDKDKWSTLETSLIDSGDVSDHPYQPQFQAFVDSLRDGQPMPLTDFGTAYESHRVVFAADLSAAEGRSVKLAELS